GGAGVAPDGEARQMWPAMVAVWRIGGEGNWCDDSQSSVSLSRTRMLVSTSRIVVNAPVRRLPAFSWVELRPGIFLMLIRHPGSSLYFISTSMSVPPAITLASSPYLASSDTASLTVFGSK